MPAYLFLDQEGEIFLIRQGYLPKQRLIQIVECLVQRGDPSIFSPVDSGMELPLLTMMSQDGHVLNSLEMIDKRFVLSFGDLACSPCMKEFLLLGALCSGDSVEWWNVAPFAFSDTDSLVTKSYPWCHMVFDAEFDIISAFGVSVSPTVFFINQKGEIVQKLEGYISDSRLRQFWGMFMHDG
jgi:hypothetical protein